MDIVTQNFQMGTSLRFPVCQILVQRGSVNTCEGAWPGLACPGSQPVSSSRLHPILILVFLLLWPQWAVIGSLQRPIIARAVEQDMDSR